MVLVFHLLLFSMVWQCAKSVWRRPWTIGDVKLRSDIHLEQLKSILIVWLQAQRTESSLLVGWAGRPRRFNSNIEIIKLSIFFFLLRWSRHHPFEQAQLKEYFDKFGEIESVNLKLDPVTGRYLCQLLGDWHNCSLLYCVITWLIN